MATKAAKRNAALPLSHGDIPRFTPEPPKTLEPTMREFANKAKTVLGYTPMAENIGKDTSITLAGILSRLGIPALDQEAVIKYKASKNRPDKGQPRVHDEEDDTDSDDIEERRDTRAYNWYTITIDDYSQPIPERVLAKAIQIKEAETDVQFVIHHLARGRRAISKDPFLEVRFRNEHFFIEVWDEPNFSNELTSEDAERANLRTPPQS